ncbi:MAG: hybrid sensor histidine kinase/response regulator, partial [Candidatus Hydrogenedentes bacterium]|nr:hybrid sensor histidine kinase/response regulator [Candidatus Hydrogenedentota bacterium]
MVPDSSDAMLALLNDILDFEKIEQGKMAFENISFDLHRLINGVTTLMNGHSTQKNITLKTKIGENLPKYV